MKYTTKKQQALAFLAIPALLLSLLSPALAFFDESIDDIVAASDSESVEGVNATAGNGSVILFWNAKTDDQGAEASKYRVEYGTQSVAEGLVEEYEFEEETIDNVPSIKIDDLENDTKYYFSVIAVFADNSETPPSTEVSVKPVSNLSQNITETPVVVSADGVSKHEVIVYFSKEVVLPEENPELAFSLTEEQDTDNILEVVEAAHFINQTGTESPSEIIITITEELDPEQTYRVTASAQITDVDGRPIESGSTDSAVFDGYDGELEYLPLAEAGEGESQTGESGQQELQEGAEGPQGEESGTEPLAEIIQEEAGENAGEQEDSTTDLEYILNSLVNENGFDAPIDAETEEDTTPPEDITNLRASFAARLTDFLVTLTWNPSADTAGDLDNQLLYRSVDLGENWGNSTPLGKEASRTNIPEKPETDITYKITTTDTSGNESVGVIRSVSLPALPQTGPGLLIAFGVALTGAGIRGMRKK